MDAATVSAENRKLAGKVAARYAQRSKEREDKLKEVEANGVYAAAGVTASIRRVAHMTVAEGRTMAATRTFEAIVGTDDSEPVNFLGRGSQAARAVCRLTSNGSPVGTGFLVAPGIMLTNNHVIPNATEAASFVAEFDYELDTGDQPRVPVVRFALEPGRLFVTSDADTGIDFTFVAVSRLSVSGQQPLSAMGWIPLDPRIDKILTGEPAVVIQHPRGEPKRIALFSAQIIDKLPEYLHYSTDTDGGASGSCVLNRSWQLVALHHAATTSDRRRRGHFETVNEGVRVSSILKALQDRSFGVIGNAAEVYAEVSKPEVIGDGRPQLPAAAGLAAAAGGSVRESVRTFEATRIGIRSADHFDDRDEAHLGYKPDFIGHGFNVPLPGLPDFLQEDAAPVTDSGVELKYMHYSAILSKSRRLPIFTAVNIDGAKSKKLGRTERDYEAADKWFYDPRVDQAHQLGPAVYDRTDFDYGHMVRREDPVWGDDNTARMANDDTFYMTNCAPQHHDLNTVTWLRLENAALAAAKNGRAKVSILTGPVLSPQDPTVLGVQVPTAFWKIVVYREGDELRAHGFMQWQTRLVNDIRVRPESLTELDKVEEYAVPIRDIARATALSFGPLLAADVLARSPEGRRRLHESTVPDLFRIPAVVAPSSPDPEPSLPASEVEHRSSVCIRAQGRDLVDELSSRVRRLEQLLKRT